MTDGAPEPTTVGSDGLATAGGRLIEGTTDPVDASTVLLLRDADDPAEGFEVFLLERHVQSDFAGGAYAFPGGKVDATDHALSPDRWSGVDPVHMMALLGADSPAHAIALLVAAVRETFEEAGVLLARHADGSPVTGADLDEDSYVDARRRLATRGEHWDWRPWLEQQDLVLDLGALVPFSWWATPHGMHRRFDTRFLVAAVPPAQRESGAHDQIEATDSVWRTPAAALAAFERGEVVIIFPTRCNLEALEQHQDVQSVLAGPGDLRRILPAIVLIDGQVRVRHPDGGPPQSI